MTDPRRLTDELADPELTAICDDARHELRRAMARHPIARNFPAVVRRAHQMDPNGVPQAMVDDARSSSGVVELRPDRQSADHEASERRLDELVTDARAAIEAHLKERRLRGIPSLRSSPSRRGQRRLTAGMLAAAAVLIILAVPDARRVMRSIVAPTGEQAALHHRELPTPHTFSKQEVQKSDVVAPVAEPEPAPQQSTTPAPQVEPEPTPAPAVRPRRASTPRHAGPADPLAELDERAQRLWRERDIAGAEAAFRELIERAGRTRRAELAYGDLFSIAHRFRGPARQAKLWREYLDLFPRGRFADDARAGLCRRATGDAASTCWRVYLVEIEDGSYRAEATRALGQAGTAP